MSLSGSFVDDSYPVVSIDNSLELYSVGHRDRLAWWCIGAVLDRARGCSAAAEIIGNVVRGKGPGGRIRGSRHYSRAGRRLACGGL